MAVKQMNTGTGPKAEADCADYYIRNDAAIRETIRAARRGQYCSILGPRYSQKSLLLKDVQKALSEKGAATVLLDMEDLVNVADSEFLQHFAQRLSRQVRERFAVAPPAMLSAVNGAGPLKQFLREYVQRLKQDLFLLIYHLEAVRIKPLESLLLALRGVHTEQTLKGKYRLVVITASSLRIAGVTFGPNSALNIAHAVIVRDLSPADSERLVNRILEQSGIQISAAGCQHLVRATGGDRYLIRTLCAYCAQLAGQKARAVIDRQEVEQAIAWFISEKAGQHRPLQEAIRALEANTASMMDVLKILDAGRVPRHEFGRATADDMDELQRTGAVTIESRNRVKYFRIRNDVYRRYLEQHFHVEQVVQVLSMAGRWEEAIDYLAGKVASAPRLKSLLLGTIIDSIYAAQNAAGGYDKLAYHLSRAFFVPRVRLYIVNPDRSRLERVSQFGFGENAEALSLCEARRPEVRAYLSKHYEMVPGAAGERKLLIPLMRDDQQALGLAVIHSIEAHPEEDAFFELLGFMKRMSRAVGTVIDRERELRQFATLYDTGRQISQSLNLDQLMQTIVEAAINAVPGAQRGALLIWDEKKAGLSVEAYKNYRWGINKEIILRSGEGYAGKVFAGGKPVLIEDATTDERVLLRDDPDISQQKSVICVPLEAWRRVIGVLCLDNTMMIGAFQERDLNLLSTFAAQAAIAIQNARLYLDLFELGMQINKRDVDAQQIFQYTVQTIMRVSAARGANLLLFHEAAPPELAAIREICLCVSAGMGADYDEKVKPRAEGMTARILALRTPYAVGEPGEGPGINDLAAERGVKAVVGLPMIIQDEIIGILFVHYDKPHPFSKNEINMLSLYANQAALAIANRRLLQELKTQYNLQGRQEAFKVTTRMVAHRLRNVLPIISDRISRALERGTVSAAGVNWCRIALREAYRAQAIIRDFEMFSRTRGYELPDRLSGFGLVEHLAGFVKDALTQPDAEVTTAAAADLPPVRVNLQVLSYDFANFVNDSERHSPGGLRVSLSCEPAGDDEVRRAGLRGREPYLKLSYVDNGPGIPHDLKQQIFEAFFTTSNGSGLGLAIASYNAATHGGAIIECGQPGRGVRFELYLPVAG